jgi:pyrroloquinoline quinone biosynthesis protein B
MTEIPHPFIVETMKRFETAPATQRERIRFIHLNRTNPAAFADSPERQTLEHARFRVATHLEIVPL